MSLSFFSEHSDEYPIAICSFVISGKGFNQLSISISSSSVIPKPFSESIFHRINFISTSASCFSNG